MAGTMMLPPPTPIIPERKPVKTPGGEEHRRRHPGRGVGSGAAQPGAGQQDDGDGEQEGAEGALELPLGEDVGVPGAEAGRHGGRDGEQAGPQDVDLPLRGVGGRPHQPGEDQGDEARAVGLLLLQAGHADHERDHHHAAAQPDQAPEAARRAVR